MCHKAAHMLHSSKHMLQLQWRNDDQNSHDCYCTEDVRLFTEWVETDGTLKEPVSVVTHNVNTWLWLVYGALYIKIHTQQWRLYPRIWELRHFCGSYISVFASLFVLSYHACPQDWLGKLAAGLRPMIIFKIIFWKSYAFLFEGLIAVTELWLFFFLNFHFVLTREVAIMLLSAPFTWVNLLCRKGVCACSWSKARIHSFSYQEKKKTHTNFSFSSKELNCIKPKLFTISLMHL